MSRCYKSGVQAKGNTGKNIDWGGITIHICHQNNNPLFPKDQNKMPTPINADQLESYLDGYDEKKKQYLLQGFRKGFSLEYQGPRKPFSCPNLKSAIDNPKVIEEKNNKELEYDRVEGPFKTKSFPNIRISPLGLVPKNLKGLGV